VADVDVAGGDDVLDGVGDELGEDQAAVVEAAAALMVEFVCSAWRASVACRGVWASRRRRLMVTTTAASWTAPGRS
jgi:hypothetical protein